MRAESFKDESNGFLRNEKKERILGFQRLYLQRDRPLAGLQLAGDSREMDLKMTVQRNFFDPYRISEIFLGGTVCQLLNKIAFESGKTRKDPERESQDRQKEGEREV